LRKLRFNPIEIGAAGVGGWENVDKVRSGTTKLNEQLNRKDASKLSMQVRSKTAFVPKPDVPKPRHHNCPDSRFCASDILLFSGSWPQAITLPLSPFAVDKLWRRSPKRTRRGHQKECVEIRFLGVRDQLDAQAGDDISPGRGFRASAGAHRIREMRCSVVGRDRRRHLGYSCLTKSKCYRRSARSHG
jgi:hypothetical protein